MERLHQHDEVGWLLWFRLAWRQSFDKVPLSGLILEQAGAWLRSIDAGNLQLSPKQRDQRKENFQARDFKDLALFMAQRHVVKRQPAPYRSLETIDANGSSNGLVDEGNRFFSEPAGKVFRARVDRHDHDCEKEQCADARDQPFQNAPQFLHKLKGGSNTEMNLPRPIAARRIKRKAQVHPDRSNGRCIAQSETSGKLQIIHGNIESTLRNLTEIDE